MTTIRRIVTSKIDGNSANSTNDSEIRPFGEAAFYVDDNGPTDKLVLAIHDGVRTHLKSKVLGPGVMFGSNADAGDDSGADTIKLIPDATLFDQGSNQYIVVDPTGGEPGHIHLRAGGTQDASTADLYLGGELTNVRVSDTSDTVRIRTSIVNEGETNYDWTFDNTGRLTFPQGGAIEAHGMGWTGLTNGDSGSPLSIAYKNAQQGNPVGLAEILLTGSTITGSIGLYTQKYPTVTAQAIYNSNGTFTADITENDDITVVQTSWTVTIDSATYPVDYVNTDVEGEFSIGVSGAVFNQGTSYTFTSLNAVGSQWSFDENGLLTLPGGGIISHANNDLKLEVSGTDVIVLRNDSGDFVFNTDGSLTFPNDVKITLGGQMEQNAINFSVPDPMDSNTRYEWSFDASYGMPFLRFPDNTLQSTALKAETIPQVGYRLMFDTDIYANETGGALTPYQTSVLLESNAQVRALFQVEAFATSTTARAYNHPTNVGEIILEVASVTGAPIDPNTSVWAIINGTPIPVGDIQSQIGDTSWVLLGEPLAAEIVLGTEFEFYASGFPSYSPTQTIILEWDDGTETEVVAGETNNPYGLGISLVTAEDQTTLNYPMILTTADYEPAEFSHVIDVDNNFKITTRADDFILNSDEGPLVIRNATSEFIFENNILTVPGTINIEGIGGVVGFTSGEDTFIGIEGTTGWGVALRATDSQLNSQDWLFGIDGSLTLPGGATVKDLPGETLEESILILGAGSTIAENQRSARIGLNGAISGVSIGAGSNDWTFLDDGVLILPGEGVIRSNDDTVILQSYDTTFNVGKGIRIGTNGHVYFELGDDPAYFQIEEAEGDAQLVARTNLTIMANSGSTIKQWTFNTNGSLTFPDSTVQATAWVGGRVVAVPTTSLGTTGDLEGDLAFNATYMYYCTQDFGGTVITINSITSAPSQSYLIMYSSNTGWTSADLTGYTVTGPSGYTGTVTGPSVLQSGTLYYIPVTPNVTQAMGNYTFTSPGGDIWKRIAWSGDTW